MGSFLWIIGIAFMSYGLIELFLGNPEKRKKKKWLLKNFGEQGMNNWLRNEFILDRMSCYNDAFTKWNVQGRPNSGYYYKRYMQESKLYDQYVEVYGKNCFTKAHIMSNGMLEGVVTEVSCMGYVGTSSEVNTPWCPGYGATRTEPNGADWLAAGFITPIWFNEKYIDPIAMYLSEGGRFGDY